MQRHLVFLALMETVVLLPQDAVARPNDFEQFPLSLQLSLFREDG